VRQAVAASTRDILPCHCYRIGGGRSALTCADRHDRSRFAVRWKPIIVVPHLQRWWVWGRGGYASRQYSNTDGAGEPADARNCYREHHRWPTWLNGSTARGQGESEAWLALRRRVWRSHV
jgi:hypothetical protein